MNDDEDRDWERQKLKLGLLEGRRTATDGFMWQAPVLSLAVQAFLLRILADESVDSAVATAVAVAGVLATSAAALGLLLLKDREHSFSGRVEELTGDSAMKIGRIRRPPEQRQALTWALEMKGYVIWTVVLASFGVVDAVVLGVTHGLCSLVWMLVWVLVAAVVAGVWSAMVRRRENRSSSKTTSGETPNGE